MPPEDTVWLADRIFTGRRYVDALLVEDGRVAAAGSRDAVRRQGGTGADVRDVGSRLVVPGLADLHMHLAGTTLLRDGVDLRGVRSLDEMRERILRWLPDHPRGPVFGRGWDQENLRERRYPTRDDLDRFVSDRPVVLPRVCGHAAVVNSAALDAVGIDESTRDPSGGVFVRDSAGRLTGVLLDNALTPMDPMFSRAFTGDPTAAGRALAYAASVGLTTLAPVSAEPEEIRIASELAERGPLPVRLRFYLDLGRLSAFEELRRLPSSSSWRIAGVKAITDGSFGARTAWLSEPYSDAPDARGFPLWDEEEIARGLEEARRLGLPPALHAIGDRAMAWALDLLERHAAPGTARIEHASMTPPEILATLARVRPDLVVQPHFVETDWWVPQRLGPVRARWTYAFRTLIERGFRLAGSSDSPVEPLDPWTGVRAAVHRAPESEFGRATAGERLAPETAVQVYSANAGEVLREPDIGTLEPGSRGDLLVLSAPGLEAALATANPPVLETWMDGRCVYRRDEAG
jgi:predicted amidohydrolase YtcJ